MLSLNTIGIARKIHDERASALGNEIYSWLTERKLKAIFVEPDHGLPPQKLDLLISVGGDGTIIRSARRLLGSGVPIAGVNVGRVGFLAELTPENWREGLEKAISEGFEQEKRLALEYSIERSGEDTALGYAINDVVMARGGLARLLDLELCIDGKKLQYLRADGLIISTPTGATAYSSSAGGPLLQPDMSVYSITAICPFLNKILPMVMGEKNIFSVRVCETGGTPFVTVDGQELFELKCGDTLRVRTWPEAVSFARFGKSDYISKLRSTGFVSDSPGAPKA